MNTEEKQSLIKKYIEAYNTFDIEAMLALIHPDVEFINISNDVINATASGIEDFRRLAYQAKELFSSRRQTIKSFQSEADQAKIEIAYQAILACDLPNGITKGETLRLAGRSEFTFRDGKIYRITDIS